MVTGCTGCTAVACPQENSKTGWQLVTTGLFQGHTQVVKNIYIIIYLVQNLLLLFTTSVQGLVCMHVCSKRVVVVVTCMCVCVRVVLLTVNPMALESTLASTED